jgi:transcriptional regulator
VHVPLPFRESDPAYIKGFLQSHGFATLVSSHQGRPMASHLLLETQGSDDSQLVLSGHMSRENPQWRTFDPVNEVLAIFQGPHSYVSAARYSVPSAPTWNYISVHVYGLPRLIEDRGELYAMLKRLVDAQEGSSPEEMRYTIESIPAGILEGMMNGVMGFQIAVTRVEAAAKLSQNRSAPDRQRIIDELSAAGSPGSLDIAREMERRKGQLPPGKG